MDLLIHIVIFNHACYCHILYKVIFDVYCLKSLVIVFFIFGRLHLT